MPESSKPRDYKLAGLIPWLRRGQPVDVLRTPELLPIYDAAQTNLHRSDGIITTIVASIYTAFLRPPDGATEPPNQDVLRLGLETWQSKAAVLEAVPGPIAPFNLGIEGVLSAYLVQAWTTFETLASDTWVTALNNHPTILAELKGGASLQRDDKKLDLQWLQRHNYDLSCSMGDALRNKFRFDSLDGIRRAYQAAFSVDFQAIIDPLNDDRLTALSAIRNVLVHRAGTVDEKYLCYTANSSLAPKVALGEAIRLDGEMVSEMLLTGRDLSIKMFLAVDDWLATH